MGNLPLHPVIVHFPIVLAVLAPLVALVILIGQRAGRLPPRTWWIAVGAWGLLAISSFVAVKTGGLDEEMVESVVAESVIETHEERAETFALSTYAIFVLAMLVMVGKNQKVRLVAGSATLVAGLVSTALVVGVGHSGGSLVYEYGAAAAHVGAGEGERISSAIPDAKDGESDDDEDHERR